MYGDDGTTVKPIWESIPLDESTLAWLDGKLSVVGGVGGGGISEEFLNVKLQGYQPKITTTNKLAYSLISGTPDLSVYALKVNIPTKLSQLTDDVVAGKYLPLTGGDISSSGRVLLALDSSDSFGPMLLLKRGNILHTILGAIPKDKGDTFGSFWSNVEGNIALILGNDGKPYFSTNSNSLNPAYELLHSGNYSNYALPKGGTAVAASKLATPRTIWGQSFDGTGNISGELTNVTTIKGETGKGVYLHNPYNNYPTNSGDLSKSVMIGTAPSVYGLGIWGKSTGHVHAQVGRCDGTNTPYNLFLQEFGGNVAIGGTTADAKLHVHGTAKFEDDATFSSKVVIGTIPVYESSDGTLYVDANVVFRGGVAMLGNTTTKINEE
jgi:hypothetical protein